MKKYGEWEVIGPLGSGGQSDVHLVRSPARVAERAKCLEEIRSALDQDKRAQLASSISAYARKDTTSELGALKVFRIRKSGADVEQRLNTEIAVLRQNRRSLPKLLDANEAEQWMVTEYFQGKTLEDSPSRYKGESLLGLKAFRSLVETVATSLHGDKIVHRDIKPANIFVGDDGNLIPGDFGIVYLPDQGTRPTTTDERVGPWEYMPQWADLGVRLENVQPNFDVYMLGKLLWCMIAGRLRLPREWHRRPEFDLTVMFPNNPSMTLINSILDKCLVEEPSHCPESAHQLLEIVDETLATIERGLPMLDRTGKLSLPCRICGKGFYQDHTFEGSVRLPAFDASGRPANPIYVRAFICNVCMHYEFFAPGFPGEAVKRGWRP